MTKEKIIDLLYNEIGNPDYKTVGDYHKGIADKLLALFNQELLERLEQLHAEMDERMREEVAIEKRMGEKKAENLLNQIEELTTGKCALRCPLVEQEKKEQVKEFVKWYKERLEHIQEHEKELLDDDVKHEYSYLVEYRKGTTDILDRLLLHIDEHLENFLYIENELAKK